jgi:hypothetical protein
MISQDVSRPVATPLVELPRLFHDLNNQLGIILANAELLENRLAEGTHRLRAGQVVASALEAIATIRQVRQAVESPHDQAGAPAIRSII